MTATRIAVAAGACALVLTAQAAADPPSYGIVHLRVPPGTSAVEFGHQLYGGNCLTCHGPNGEGISSGGHGAGDQRGAGPSLRGVGALAADFYLRLGYMPMAKVGIEPRRSAVLFSRAEVDALVAYVASLGPGPPVPSPQPHRGSISGGPRLFTEHCAGCHQVAAQGGYLPGAVAPSLQPDSPVQIAEAVRIGPYLMPRFSTTQLSNSQLDSIIAYLETAKHPDDRGGWAIGHVGPVPEGLVAWLIATAALVATCVVIGKRGTA